jgi:DNA-3-methyladenine glycosylase II
MKRVGIHQRGNMAMDLIEESRPGGRAEHHRRSGRIACAPPFDLGASLAFLYGFGPMRGEQGIAAGELTKALVHRGQVVAFRVHQAGTVERPELAYRLISDRPIGAATEEAVARRVGFFLSAGEDLEPFYQRAGEDPQFAPVAARLRGLHHVKFPTPFEAACWGAINQRIQIGVARGMKERLCRRLGGHLIAGGTEHLAFPEADTIAGAGEGELRAVLGNERKARAVAAVARAFAGVDETFLREAPLSEVEAWLLGIHGVGPFTSAFVLFRGLGRFARQPMSPRLTAAAAEVYGRQLSTADMESLSRSYGAWGGHWALYLWASTFLPRRTGS